MSKRGRKADSAEKWLSENDPEYDERKRGWQVPSTDALTRTGKRKHGSLRGLERLPDGNYRRISTDSDNVEDLDTDD